MDQELKGRGRAGPKDGGWGRQEQWHQRRWRSHRESVGRTEPGVQEEDEPEQSRRWGGGEGGKPREVTWGAKERAEDGGKFT